MAKKDRHRKTYDLPPEITELIRSIAQEYRVTESQVVALLLAKGLLDFDYSELARRLQESRSLYYDSNIDISDLLDRLK